MGNTLLQYVRSIFAIILFHLLRIFFTKINQYKRNILFIHTAGLGDLIYTFKIICNLEKLDNYNYFLMVKEEHKGLFDDYKGNFKIIFLNYDMYRLNIFYRIKVIKVLRDYTFLKVFQLNHNRRIIDDDLAVHTGANQIVAFNIVEKGFPKLFKQMFDRYYDRILFEKPQEINTKIDIFLQQTFNINHFEKTHISMDEKKILNSLNSKISRLLDQEYIIINPLSSAGIRDWNFDQLNEIVVFLSEQYNYKIFLVGNTKQYKFLQRLTLKSDKIINLGGLTDILESFLIVKYCKLFIGIDSALSHVARYFDIQLHSSTLQG